jgi:glycosyltransferase involved in cell wall biosynthesis
MVKTPPVKISIVIPAYNEEKLIAETLRSIHEARAAFDSIHWQSELIVCDNNSSDRTAVLAREAGATVVFEPINQIGRARNTGARAADGDWLIFVDADSQPSQELFAEVAVQIRRGDVVAGGSTVKLDDDDFWYNFWAAMWNRISRWRRYMAGSFIFCNTGAFREVGGFGEELFVAEELELSLKLKKLALRDRKTIVVLDQHPLLTSARKAHLYSMREHLWFLLKTAALGGRNLKRRDGCPVWYDGRR